MTEFVNAYMQGMGTEGKVICLIVVLIFIGVILSGVKDMLVAIFRGHPPARPIVQKIEKPTPKCDHEDNLQKLCLRGSDGCATRRDCEAAVVEGDY